MDEPTETARRILVESLEGLDLAVDQVGEQQWMTMVAGEWKRTIPVLFDVGERSVRVSSLLAGAPDENHGEVHELLLHRNERARWVHFALTDVGDVVLVGRVVLEALSPEVVDELLGEILSVSDETFNSVLRTGFESYIDVEQRWRAANGMPPNPVSTKG